MRRLTFLVALAVITGVTAGEAAKPTKPAATKPAVTRTQPPKGGAPKAASVKAGGVKASTAKGSGARAAASTPKTAKGAKAAKADARAARVEARTATATSGSTGSPVVAPTSIDFTATTLGRKLEKNSALRSKIETKLQAAGYTGTVYEAAHGFKNVGQLNAAVNQVQNQGYSFELLKVLTTGTYVDPQTHTVYRANQLPDGTTALVRSDLAASPTSTVSLGGAKKAIAGGAGMPPVVSSGSTPAVPAPSTGATSTVSSTTSSKRKGKPTATQSSGGGSF